MKKLIFISLLFVSIITPNLSKAWWARGLLVFNEYPVALSEEFFNTLYDSINKKYLWETKLSDLVSKAVLTLNDIDQNVRIADESDRVLVYYNHNMVKTFNKPQKNNSEDWARLTVEVLVSARTYSQKIKDLKPEVIHKKMTVAVLSMLDGFSHYIPIKNKSDDKNILAETGIRFKKVGRLLEIVSIISGSSAESLENITVGDFISHIDGEEISPMDSQVLIDKLNGTKNSTVNLTVIDKDSYEVHTVKVARTLISPNPINYEMENNILFIMIYGFNKATVGKVKEAVASNVRKQNVRGIILDLRGNPGGLFEQAIGVADLFLDKGVITYTKGRYKEAYQYYEADNSTVISNDIPMVVMIDGKTASAAEVLASALQDNGRAVVLGTTTFGKGTVQTIIKLPDDNEFSLTWSRFHAPSGYPLHSLGVFPSVCYPDKSGNTRKAVIDNLPSHYEEIYKNLNRWRDSKADNYNKHKKNREICPPLDRFFEKEDKMLAKVLLLDKLLYENITNIAKFKPVDDD